MAHCMKQKAPDSTETTSATASPDIGIGTSTSTEASSVFGCEPSTATTTAFSAASTATTRITIITPAQRREQLLSVLTPNTSCGGGVIGMPRDVLAIIVQYIYHPIVDALYVNREKSRGIDSLDTVSSVEWYPYRQAYALADCNHRRIRLFNPLDRSVSTLCQLSFMPHTMVLDPQSGDLLLADRQSIYELALWASMIGHTKWITGATYDNSMIWQSRDGKLNEALFGQIAGVALHPRSKNLYVVDRAAQTVRVVLRSTLPHNNFVLVKTVAGKANDNSTSEGHTNGPALSASLRQPTCLLFDLLDPARLYIGCHGAIRLLNLKPPATLSTLLDMPAMDVFSMVSTSDGRFVIFADLYQHSLFVADLRQCNDTTPPGVRQIERIAGDGSSTKQVIDRIINDIPALDGCDAALAQLCYPTGLAWAHHAAPAAPADANSSAASSSSSSSSATDPHTRCLLIMESGGQSIRALKGLPEEWFRSEDSVVH